MQSISDHTPHKNLFQVRTRPELHRAVALLAMKRGVSLNDVVTREMETAVDESEHAA